jgi:hypothetical protein
VKRRAGERTFTRRELGKDAPPEPRLPKLVDRQLGTLTSGIDQYRLTGGPSLEPVGTVYLVLIEKIRDAKRKLMPPKRFISARLEKGAQRTELARKF